MNRNPSDAQNNPFFWLTLAEVLGVGAYSERVFVAVSSGTLALSQNTSGSYTYNIADFGGTGVDTAQIRKIYIECVTTDNVASSTITCTFPGTARVICGSSASGSGDSTRTALVAEIPVNKDTPSITLTNIIAQSGSAAFTIFGVVQRA